MIREAAAGAGRGAACVGLLGGCAERFVHDAADGADAAAAFGAAAEAAVNFAGLPARRGGDGGADIGVGQYVAGTDDHEAPGGVSPSMS